MESPPLPPPPPPPQPETIIQPVTYKPFADDHNNKFSLGDFDSPYLVRLNDYTNFVASNSSILLNDITNEVVKTDYQGGVYLGIAGFRFNDYTSFLSTNAALTIKVNLVASDGSVITNKTIASGLMVTKATNLYTWQDLQGMKHNLAGGYELMNDITFPDKGSEGLPPEGFEPVGDDSAGDDSDNFTGSFAGNNHTIINLSIERPTRNLVGIWGYVNDADSVIRDFVLDHAGIRGDRNVGAVVGTLSAGMVSNVGVVSRRNSNVSGNDDVGGLVGASGGTVIGYATGAVSGNENLGERVGGLVGVNAGTVTGYTTGAVSGNSVVGGLVGWNSTGTVEGYATGSISVTTHSIGGLAGANNGVLTGYATGSVSGNGRIGGLVGQNGGMVNGYWDIGSTERMGGFGANTVTFNGLGISSITHVVYDSGTDTYTDTKGTPADTTDDIMVFDNQAFTSSFTLPGDSATWPTLNAANSFPQQP